MVDDEDENKEQSVACGLSPTLVVCSRRDRTKNRQQRWQARPRAVGTAASGGVLRQVTGVHKRLKYRETAGQAGRQQLRNTRPLRQHYLIQDSTTIQYTRSREEHGCVSTAVARTG